MAERRDPVVATPIDAADQVRFEGRVTFRHDAVPDLLLDVGLRLMPADEWAQRGEAADPGWALLDARAGYVLAVRLIA